MDKSYSRIGLWVSVIVLSLTGLPRTSHGQEIFRGIGLEQGLSNGSVTSILQDSEGFIWVGTKRGLNKYDGKDFTIYKNDPEDSCSLGADNVTSITEDRQHRLWISTFEGGLNRYDRNTDRFEVFKHTHLQKNSLSSNAVNVVFEDHDGSIWIGTEEGLCLLHETTKTFTTFKHDAKDPFSISHNNVQAIFDDQAGNLWIGTLGGGLNKFEKEQKRFTSFRVAVKNENSISSDFIWDIEKLDDDHLLIATNGGGINVMDVRSNTFVNFFEKNAPAFNALKTIRKLLLDENLLWIGSEGGGLLKVDLKREPYTVTQRTSKPGLSSLAGNSITALLKDSQQNLWIGTAWNGISLTERSNDHFDFLYSDMKGDDPAPVLSFYIDRHQNLWIGTDGKGLTFHDPVNGETIHYNTKNTKGLIGNYINSIYEDTPGNIWIGSFDNGLTLLSRTKHTLTNFKHDINNASSLAHDDVRAILERDNKLWIGTWGGGISLFDKDAGTFTNYRHDENDPTSISSNDVVSLERKSDNAIWVATFGGGLNLLDEATGKFQHFSDVKEGGDNEIDNNILSLCRDSNNNLWIGTWSHGLCRVGADQSVRRYDRTDGLISNTVTAIQEDRVGNIWMSTKAGISCLDPATGKFRNFSYTVGLQGNELHINSTLKDAKGNLYFGGTKGIVAFDPEEVQPDTHRPNVAITGFELFNEPAPLPKDLPIVLTHNQNVFTFNFAALVFPNSNQCRYAIKMENFDDTWRDIGSERSATYTNLPQGDYIFRVKAKTGDGSWNNENIVSVKLKILPPPWKTWWAYTIYVLLFVFLLFLFQRYAFILAATKNNLKLEKLSHEQDLKLNQQKVDFLTNISHEIRTPLTLIVGPLDNILNSQEPGLSLRSQLWTVKKNADRLLKLANELMNFSRLEARSINLRVVEDNLVSLIEEIYLSFREHATLKKIQYRFVTSHGHILAWYDKDQMEKVVYNLISNAFKFTREGEITICLTQHDSGIELSVEDTGQGMPERELARIFERFYQGTSLMASDSGFGIGLFVARDIVDLHGGEISVQSHPGKGSKFTVKLRKGRAHFSDDQIAQTANAEDVNDSGVMAEASDVSEREEDSVMSEFSDFSILVVEDNNELRDYLVASLQHMGIVHEASNGKEGYEKVLETAPDLIITDIVMPLMDGVSFCKTVKADMRTSHIPVIMLTARASWLFKIEGYETGADDYITKPFNESLLKVRIRNLIENRKILRQHYRKETLLLPKEEILDSPDEKFLQRMVAFIESNIEVEFKIDQLAREIGMSHSLIYKKIKALTGQNINEFIREFRLSKAAQLLRQNTLSVIDVCYKVGYTDRRYFSHAFRKKFGQSPTEFARQKAMDK